MPIAPQFLWPKTHGSPISYWPTSKAPSTAAPCSTCRLRSLGQIAKEAVNAAAQPHAHPRLAHPKRPRRGVILVQQDRGRAAHHKKGTNPVLLFPSRGLNPPISTIETIPLTHDAPSVVTLVALHVRVHFGRMGIIGGIRWRVPVPSSASGHASQCQT